MKKYLLFTKKYLLFTPKYIILTAISLFFNSTMPVKYVAESPYSGFVPLPTTVRLRSVEKGGGRRHIGFFCLQVCMQNHSGGEFIAPS